MALTKITGGIISQPINLGIITATTGFFSGIVTAQSVRVLGDLTVDGSTTTLDTVVTEVDRLEIGANNTTVGVAITQSGTGNALTIDDGTSRVFTVQDGGSVRIGDNASYSAVSSAGNLVIGSTSGGNGISILSGNTGNLTGTLAFGDSTSGNAGAIFYRHNDNTMLFRVAGGTRMSIRGLSGGRVGIGTTNPTQSLHIYNSSPIIQFTDPDSGLGSRINADNGNLYFDTHNQNRDVVFRGGNSSTDEVARITGDGLVGIGTNDPSALMHLYGSSPKLYFTDTDTNIESQIDNDSGGGNFAINVDVNNVAGSDANFMVRFNQTAPVSAAKFLVNQTGNVGIGTGVPTGSNALTNNTAVLAVGIVTTNSLFSSELKVADNGSIDVTNPNPGNAVLDIINSGNGNVSGINFIRERSSGTGINGGSIFMPSNTANNEAFLYIQAQSANAQAGQTGALSANNGVRLKLHGDDGIFSIETGDSEKLRITGIGSVGIGTANPKALLDIGGNTDGNIQAIMTRGADTSFQLQFRNETSSNSANATVGMFGLFRNATDIVGMQFKRGAGVQPGSLTVTTGGTEKLRIDSTGKIGIGVNATNPSFQVQIHESDNTAYAANATVAQLAVGNVNSSSATNSAGIHLFTDGNGRGVVNLSALNNSTNASADFVVQTRHSATLAERLRITSAGNVGINSTSPATKLDVRLGAAWIYPDDDGTEAIALKLGKLRDYNTSFNDILVADNDNATTPTYTVTNKINRYIGNWHFDRITSPGATRINAFKFRSSIEGANLGNKFTMRDRHDTIDSVKLWSEGNSFIGVGTAGTTINVGIGTNDPDFPLHVFHPTSNNVALFESGDAFATMGLSDSNGSVSFLTTLGSLRIGVGGDAGTIGDNSTLGLTIKNNGNVGIGTDNPAVKLDVIAGGVNNAAFFKTTSDKALIEFENGAGSTYNTRIGSTTIASGNVGLRFETGTSSDRLQAMVIDRYGKVGIGSDNPTQALDVNGKIKVFGSDGSPYGLVISPDSNGGTYEHLIAKMNGDLRLQAGSGTYQASNANILLKNNKNIVINAGNAGKVGIGTNVPGGVLDVLTSMGRIKFNNSGSIGSRIDFANADGTVKSSIHNYGGSNEILTLDAPSTIQLRISNSPKFHLASNGNIGIGTVTPDHNLHVYQEAGDAVITIESTGNGNHSALEFFRTSSGGDSKGAGSIYVTGDTSESAAKMKFGVAHNISHGSFPRMTIDGQNGHVGIGTENPVKALHVEHSDCRIRLTEVGEATDVELQNDSGHGILSTNGSSQLRFLTNNEERLIITAAGHIVTQDLGLTGTSFNNDTSDAKVLEVTGEGTAGKYGVINISGNSNSNSDVIGRIYFINRENSNSSSVSSANSKALAYIDTYATSTDSNAGDDCGGILRFSTKRDGAGSLERIRITNDGRIGINDNSPNGYEVDLQNRSDSTGNDTQVRIYNTQTGAVNDTVMRYQIAGTTANNYIYFGDGDDANAGQIRYNHNSDFLALNVNAEERIRITSGGDVGIGTNIPASELHLFAETGDCVLTLEADRGNSSSNENDNPYIVFKQDGSTAMSAIGMNPNGVNAESNALVLVNGAGSGAMIFKTGTSGNYTSGTSQRLRIEPDGDVLIYNNTKISGICTANTGFMFGTDGQHYLYQSDSDRVSLRITSDGPYAEFKDVSGDVQMGSASGTLLLSAGGNEKVRITSDGKVGINSTSPQTQLDVVGDDGLMVRTSTNGGAGGDGGAIIKMTDQTPTNDQAGFIKYRHVDGQSPGDNYGSTFTVTSETSSNAFVIGDFEHDNIGFNNDLLVKRNVGIGTDIISRAPLQIHRRSNDDVQIHMTNNETGVGSGNGFTIFGGAGTSGRDMGFVNRETTGAIEFYTNLGGTLAQRGSWHTGPDITTFCINTASNGNHSNIVISNHDTTDYNGVADRTEYPMLSDIHFTGSDNPTANRTHAAWRNDVENSITTGSNSSGNRIQIYGIHSTVNSTKYAYILYGGYLFANTTANNAAYTQSIIGSYGYAQGYINASSSVLSANIYGGHFIGYRGGNTIGGHCYGAIARAQQTTNGVASKTGDMTGMLGEVEVDEGQITNGYSFRAIIDVDNNTGDGVSAASTITSAHLYHGTYSVQSGATVTNRRGIWLTGCTDSNIDGDLTLGGSLTANGGKPFRIPHPLVGLSTTKDLVHTAIEGPQVDNLYRGKTTLVAGISTVNLDTKSGMTEGTFVALNRDVQCFTTNETGWTNVKGSVTGNQLTIIAQENTCTDTISWMVIGERQDDAIKASTLTDIDGKLILEPDQKHKEDPVKYECEDNIHNADPNHNPKDD